MTAAAPETTWTFDIPEQNAEALRSKMAKLQRRAAKLDIAEPIITEGEPKDVKVATHCEHTGRVTGHYIQRYIPFTVTQVEPVQFNGWTFVGTIDHGTNDNGEPLNVIRSTPAYAGNLPKSYRHDAATCDHCQLQRNRNETFVVHHEDGELRRVGRQCIRDFLGGKEGKDIIASATWLRTFRAAFDDAEGGCGFGTGPWRVSMLDALAWTAATIRDSGWLSRGKARFEEATPTADIAWSNVTRACGLRRPARGEEPLPELAEQDATDAVEAIEWARAIDPDTDSDYLHNLRVIVSRGSVSAKEIGLAASAVAVYQRERDKAIAERMRTTLPSEWMGEVGQRFGGKGKNGIPAIEANVIRRFSFDGLYGTTTVIVAQTDEGNEVISFNTGDVASDAIVGKRVAVIGTIKRHDTDKRSGRKQTNINRASYAVVGDAPKAPVVKAPVAAAPVAEEAPAAPAHTEVQAEPVTAQESSEGMVIVLTAKTPEGQPFTASFASAAAAVQAGVEGRASGSLNWRTIRYTLDGEPTNTPTLRKLAKA